MHRLCAVLIAVVAALLWHAPAEASGDFSCSPSWRLGHGAFSECDNMAMLQPGNDTRVNLALLLLDLRSKAAARTGTSHDALVDWPGFLAGYYPEAKKPEEDDNYSDGEGSRCRSNESGAAAFAAAVGAAHLPPAEASALTAARDGLQPDCNKANGGDAAIAALEEKIKSPAAKSFAHYLQGTAAFYDADYDAAAKQFGALAEARQPWLRETARYMLGRVEVNRAQLDAFDEYGTLKDKAVDAKIIAAAETALRAYLRDYPKGLYANSARGLLRRVYWLGSDNAKLAVEFVALFAEDPGKRGISDPDLLNEIDNKLLPRLAASETKDPILLAVLDLQAMRKADGAARPMARSVIEGQSAAFASNPALFDFLLAAHSWYVGHDPAEALRLIPDAARQGSFGGLQFSRQALRGMALDATNDRNARRFWLDMLGGAKAPFQRPAIELAMAMHDERTSALARVFEKGSPVQTPAIREILLTNVAPPALLRQQAKDMTAPRHERELALFTLLYKGVTHGQWHDFLGDLALVPADAPTDGSSYDLSQGERPYLAVFTRGSTPTDHDCPALKETAGQLARDAADPKARLCLAEFVRVKGFDQDPLDTQPPKSDLGGTPSLFPGKPYSRLEAYKALIAEPKVAGDDKAYALYRAVNCYAPSGNNSCGGVDVPVGQRKAWFNRLKKDYPGNYWAKDLHYFW
jgi:hypothetical protein